MNDDFYIGYHDKAAPAQARFVRRAVIGMAVLVGALAALLAARQQPQPDGRFEFGASRAFEGVLYELPVPTLRVLTNGGVATNFVLVGFGKHGLPGFARGHDGKKVRFNGTLIQKDRLVMIELNDEKSFQVLGEPAAHERRGASESLGEVSLTGELVDTKCWSGVMRPATGKVHRACAVRCLSGGVPPGLLVRDEQGNAVVVLLAGADGGKLAYDVEWAARVVQARGELELRDDLPVLRVTALTLE